MRAALRTAVLAALALAACGPRAAAVPRSMEDYAAVPAPSAGDIQSISSVYGPILQEFWFSMRRAARSDTLESFSATEFHLQYGLTRRMTLGVTALYLRHDMGTGPTGLPVNKRGAGDTRVFLKWVAPVYEIPNVAVGLRPALRVPTGYDNEGDGLKPFTTGTIDFDLVGLLAYETPKLGLYINPGLSLPGGRWHNEVIGGLGVDVRGGLPLGLRAKAEYFSRYDIPGGDFQHSAFGALERDLFMGLAVEVGYRKDLVQGEDPGAEFTLGISHGRLSGVAPSTLRAPVAPISARIEVTEVAFAEADPLGLAPRFREALVREISRCEGLSASFEDRKADYTASLEVLSTSECSGRSLSIPKLLATPQAIFEIAALVTVYDPAGQTVLDRRPVNLRVTRGMGMTLFPTAGDEDARVPSPQTRVGLRADVVGKLARRAAAELNQAVRAHAAAKAAEAAAGNDRSAFGRARGFQR